MIAVVEVTGDWGSEDVDLGCMVHQYNCLRVIEVINITTKLSFIYIRRGHSPKFSILDAVYSVKY